MAADEQHRRNVAEPAAAETRDDLIKSAINHASELNGADLGKVSGGDLHIGQVIDKTTPVFNPPVKH